MNADKHQQSHLKNGGIGAPDEFGIPILLPKIIPDQLGWNVGSLWYLIVCGVSIATVRAGECSKDKSGRKTAFAPPRFDFYFLNCDLL